MNAFPWRRPAATGDDDHERLFRRLASIERLAAAGAAGGAVAAAVDDVLAFADGHFAVEEARLEDAGDPSLAHHRQAHRMLRWQLGCLREALADGAPPQAAMEVVAKMTLLFCRHVVEVDGDTHWAPLAEAV